MIFYRAVRFLPADHAMALTRRLARRLLPQLAGADRVVAWFTGAGGTIDDFDYRCFGAVSTHLGGTRWQRLRARWSFYRWLATLALAARAKRGKRS
jgi:hypothetical protein